MTPDLQAIADSAVTKYKSNLPITSWLRSCIMWALTEVDKVWREKADQFEARIADAG